MNEIIQLIQDSPKEVPQDFIKLGMEVAFKMQSCNHETKKMLYEMIGETLEDNVDYFIQGASQVIEDKTEQKFMIDAVTQITLYSDYLNTQLVELQKLPKTPEVESMLSTLEELNVELKKRVTKKLIK